ncbi:MAG: hypothetical protein V8S95_07790 [Odoribacter sp.]
MGEQIHLRKMVVSTPNILIKAFNGALDFGILGQPLICGSLSTFEHEEDGRTYGYDKVIMQAGGIGFANRQQAMSIRRKQEIKLCCWTIIIVSVWGVLFTGIRSICRGYNN